MRIIACFIILAITQPTYGDHPFSTIPILPTVQEMREWETGLDQGKNSLVYEVADRLFHLPKEPWTEDGKRLLLKVLNRHQEIRKALKNNRPVIWEGRVPRDRGHYAGNMVEMASWQKDPRFIPFIADHIGGGGLPEESLANLGESAFDAIMINLTKRFDGWSNQDGAASVCEIWLRNKVSFLHSGQQRERLKQELFRMSIAHVPFARINAVRVLRHFDDRDVFTHLEVISHNDNFTIGGQFPIRSRAQEALQFIRARSSEIK